MRVKKKNKSTICVQAILLAFQTTGDNARDYGYELIERLMNIDGFAEKVFEKKLSMGKQNRARITIVIRVDADIDVEEDMMKNHSVQAAIEMLKSESDNVKKIKVQAGPYFIKAA